MVPQDSALSADANPTTMEPAPRKFWVKTLSVPNPSASQPSAPTSKYGGLYLRLHGDGINSVVLTQKPPIFLRAHMEISDQDNTERSSERGRVISTSTAEQHAGRWWGLVLNKFANGSESAGQENKVPIKRRGWEEVQIVESTGDEGWVWEKEGKREVLRWHGVDAQLFWVTDQLRAELPPFCEWVEIGREFQDEV